MIPLVHISFSPIPTPTLPLKGREFESGSSPFKGEVRRGMGQSDNDNKVY
jgi:hypothetical protein